MGAIAEIDMLKILLGRIIIVEAILIGLDPVVKDNIRKLIKYRNTEIQRCSEMRLYDLKKYRTNYRTNRVNYNDIFFLLFHLGLILVHLIESGKI